MPECEIQPRLFPPVEWFAGFREGHTMVIDRGARWNKRVKDTHRYEIADVNGRQSLTVPVSKPDSFTAATLADIRLSAHGQWWHVHRVTLESAYGRTPFFEFYFPRLMKFFSATTVDEYPCLWQYLEATIAEVTSMLQLDNAIECRDTVTDSCSCAPAVEHHLSMPPYWQVRADKFGFLPGLSVLDLIFNLGPEAALYIRRLAPR